MGSGNIILVICVLYLKIFEYQKWKFGRLKNFKDRGGILQEVREIINMKFGKCLDVIGIEGNGNIGIYFCIGELDQYFYFCFRGKLLVYGRFQVQNLSLVVVWMFLVFQEVKVYMIMMF